MANVSMDTKYVTQATLDRNVKSGKWLLVRDDATCLVIQLTRTVQVKTRTRSAGDRYFVTILPSKR